MSDLRTAAQQALEALEKLVVGSEYEEAVEAERAIYALRAALAEDALQKFTDVSQEIEAALAEPVQEPVAWIHVPHPGNGMSQTVSLSPQREPSMYAASVPLFLREKL